MVCPTLISDDVTPGVSAARALRRMAGGCEGESGGVADKGAAGGHVSSWL
jgi:hypothetical protein